MPQSGFTHEKSFEGETNVWLTPRWLIDALGPFDLDPCAATTRPFDCATHNYVEADDGLRLPWHGLVWMNPPYGPNLARWFARLIDHDNGISLTFARTETSPLQLAMSSSAGILFPNKRVRFLREDGTVPKSGGSAPSVIMAFGTKALTRMLAAEIPGVVCFGGRRIRSDEAQRSLFDEEGDEEDGLAR